LIESNLSSIAIERKSAVTSLEKPPPDASASVRMEKGPSHPMAILAICCMSLFLVTMDMTIVNVALPAIGRDLHASVSGLQWSIDGYTVVIASFLMLAGSTADRFGRRRIFLAGLTLFSLGSFLCSLAPTISVLVLYRVIQALGGSMLNPVAMSIIVNTFTVPRERARAIGLWGAVTGVSMAAGPLLGGVLTQTIGWRSIFAVNVPIGLAAIALTLRFVPESRAKEARRFDPVGQTLTVIAFSTLISALIEGPQVGWLSPAIVGGFAVAAVAFAALVAYELRRFEPLIDLRFFRSVPFSAATAIAVLAFTAFGGFLFLTSLYLQEARGLSALDAGLCMLPTAGAMFVCSPLSGRLVGAKRARVAMVIAGAAMSIGALLLTGLRVDLSLAHLLVAFAVIGVGMGMVNPPITNTAVSSIPRAQAGLAAALASTSRVVGASLGVALAGSIVDRGTDTAAGVRFGSSTHPFWWLVVGCGLVIAALGVASTRQQAPAAKA
jgi:EmrB/QacA subfamily drug resistance transporter